MEADLVAAIAAHPDDDAGYLVYGDWLQQRGDPRGELIALHHAGDAAAADRYLAEHRDALLGELAHRRGVTLTWHLGFVQRAAIVAGHEDDALALVRIIADEAACRFLRRLAIVLDGKRRSYRRIDALLAELARPQTLAEIELGKPGDHLPSAALRDAFPGLARADDPWPAVVARIAKLRAPATSLDPADLATLERPNGVALPLEPAALVAALQTEIAKRKALGIVAAIADTCTASARDRYAAALVTAWFRANQRPTDAWVFEVAAVLGGRQTAASIGRKLPQISYQRAVQGIDALARIDHPQAILELFVASRGHTQRATHAERVLGSLAHAGKRSVGGMVARAGAAKIADDAVGRRAVELDAIAVEWLMLTGWTARARGAIAWFVTSSRAHRMASLVWARHRAGRLEPFRWVGERAVDVAGEALELAPEDVLSIVHPALLADVEIARWREIMTQSPGFPQLDRELPLQRGATLDELHTLVAARTRADLDALRARGFREGGFDRETETRVVAAKKYLWLDVEYTVAVTLGQRIAVSHPELPPVVLHEAARDLIR